MFNDFLPIISGINQSASIIEKLSNLFSSRHILKCYRKHSDFIILNSKKSVTIFGNGHGVVTCSFDIYVVNPENFHYFNRAINVEDGDKNFKFPKLEVMLKLSKSKRFQECGFWYNCDNEIISDVEEFYWDDNIPEEENPNLINNDKELRWRFKINTNNLTKGKMYNITYSLSIPGMYPIEDFKICKNKMNSNSKEMRTSLFVNHYVDRFEYIISFEKGDEKTRFNFKEDPVCNLITLNVNNKSRSRPIKAVNNGDNFYTRYKYTINKPKFQSTIRIKWKFK